VYPGLLGLLSTSTVAKPPPGSAKSKVIAQADKNFTPLVEGQGVFYMPNAIAMLSPPFGCCARLLL